MPSLRFRMVSLRFLWAAGLALGAAQVFAGCGGQTTGAGPTPEEVDADLCAKAAELGCISLSECKASLEELRGEATKDGCTSQMDAALGCFARDFTSCTQGVESVCPTEAAAYDACSHGAPPDEVCSGGGTSSECALDCSSYSAECYVLANSQVECRCTAGPNFGQYFEGDCTNINSAADVCR